MSKVKTYRSDQENRKRRIGLCKVNDIVVSLTLFILVNSALFYSALRFFKRKDDDCGKDHRDDIYGKQQIHSVLLNGSANKS